MGAEIFTGTIFEDGAATLFARVKIDSAAGALSNVQQSDVDTLTYGVWDEAGTATVAAGTSLTVSDVVYNSLQTGSAWTRDSTGYNFRLQLAASAFPNPGNHRVETKWTLTSGRVFFCVFNVTVLGVFTS